jgi:hypothetical protein
MPDLTYSAGIEDFSGGERAGAEQVGDCAG